ncbi:MAG TPA: S53 family peptidase [Rhodanobacteraceae bacterium]|nr:S53 family peptidase [Rhodanobacteraceae bacterium]
MSHKSHMKRLVVGLGLAVASLACAAAPAGTKLVARAAVLHTGDMVTGPMSLAQPMRVSVSLQLRNEAQLQAFIANPNHPNLTPAQFTAQYGPSEADANAVATWLTQHGFSDVSIASNRLLVSATAPAAAVQSTFHVSLVRVHTHDGRNAFANSSDAAVPVSLHGVNGVLGLQTVHVPHPVGHVMKGKPGGGGGGSIIGHNPTQFPSIYGGASLPTAAGVTVGIISNGDLSQTLSDLNTFTSQNGLATVTTQIVNTGGTGTDTSGTAEWDLDSQDIVGMGGGQVGKIVFYNIPTLLNSSMVADFNTVVNANVAKVINVSLGECETSAQGDGSAAAADAIFQQADAQGQTFSVSSGDSGSNECGKGGPRGSTPSWPASSPYVVAVGGTTLNATTTAWQGETVWSGTGGSPSTFEPIPSWQVGVGQNAGHTTRGVPDIAFDADPNSGAVIVVNGSPAQYGGTSLSSPLFVGFWARMIAAKGTGIGFAAPKLYQLPASAFHDVTSGNNGAESAAPGWDYCTGFGSIVMSQAATSL